MGIEPTARDADTPSHTPGPWVYRPHKYDDWGYVRAATTEDGMSPFICQAKAPTTEDQENECRRAGTDPWQANARLIAAAPDLLDALVKLRSEMTDLEASFNPFVDAAIAKAKGEKP